MALQAPQPVRCAGQLCLALAPQPPPRLLALLVLLLLLLRSLSAAQHCEHVALDLGARCGGGSECQGAPKAPAVQLMRCDWQPHDTTLGAVGVPAVAPAACLLCSCGEQVGWWKWRGG